MYRRKRDVDYIIMEVLFDLKISRKYRGYRYVAYGLKELLKDETLLNYISKGLYVVVGAKYNVEENVIERDIRTIKKIAWRYNSNDPLFKGYPEAPCNGVFMDLLLYEVQRRMREYEIEDTMMEIKQEA